MIKNVLYVVLMIISSIACFSQTDSRRSNCDCYLEKIRLNTKDKEYKDTVVLLRNYIDKNAEKRIICNNVNIDAKTNNEVWKSKYLETYLTYQNKMNKFSIIQYKIANRRDTIARYFLCDKKTKETVEMNRFKITNKKISGINIFPSFVEGFIPVEEYDNPHFDAID